MSPLLLDLALKSTAVMLLALAVVGLLSRASAAWRHLVWCLSVTSLLVLPALSVALPAWRVTWLPQWAAEPIRTASSPAIVQVDRTGFVAAPPSTAINLPAPAATVETETQPSRAAAAPETTGPARGSFPWLAIAWVAGGLLSLVPLAVGIWQLVALNRQSRGIEDPLWQAQLRELQQQLAVRRRVQLRESATALMPVTWGALRPVVLLPAEASDWPVERRRLVLLHELAHIRRGDWLTQLVAHLACAVHWFNPLVWLAARQMRIEREQACDDLVLAAGIRASDYAQELLALAAGLSHGPVSALVAVPMARRGALEDRVSGILDPRRSRVAVTMAAVCLGTALALAAAAPLAMLRAAPPAPSQNSPGKPNLTTRSPRRNPPQTNPRPVMPWIQPMPSASA